MTTTDRAEINRRNAMRSTGPRTPEGKERSKFNAVKHGMSAATPVLPGEDPDAFRHRLDAWAQALQPDDVVEQFLVAQAATASWKIERADRVEAARVAAALRDAEADQRAGRRAEADRLGRLLIGRDGPAADPALARAVLEILDPRGPSGPAADGRAPLRPIVDRLEATAEGCAWLLGCWAELRAPLAQGPGWDEGQLVRAVRLSGRQPLNLTPEQWEVHTVNRLFADVEGLESGGDAELDEERQEALDAAIEARVKAADRRKLARQLVADWPEDEAGERSALLGLVERAIGRLSARAAAHEARWEAEAVERAERMTFDPDPDDERLWRYQFGCGRSLRQALDTLLKLRRRGRGPGPGARAEPDHSAAPPTVPAGARGEEEPGPAPPAVRVQAAAPTPLPEEVIALVDAPTSVPNEASILIVDHPGWQDEAIAPAVAPPSLQNEARTPAADHPSLPDEATAPAVAQASLPDEATSPRGTGILPVAPITRAGSPCHERAEATAPAVDPPGWQNEAIALAGGAARPLAAVPVTALVLLALLFSSVLAATFGASVPARDASLRALRDQRSGGMPPCDDHRSRPTSHDDHTMRNEPNAPGLTAGLPPMLTDASPLAPTDNATNEAKAGRVLPVLPAFSTRVGRPSDRSRSPPGPRGDPSSADRSTSEPPDAGPLRARAPVAGTVRPDGRAR